jgi:glutamate--cysteine ligase catalytic subunit
MERAQRRDAARKARFWFRRTVYPPGEERERSPSDEIDLPTPPSERVEEDELSVKPRHRADCGSCNTHAAFLAQSDAEASVTGEYEEMTINEIINGKVSGLRLLRVRWY